MSKTEYSYDVEKDTTEEGIQFLFESVGEREIVKAIQYTYIQELMGRQLYNLGFGDYDPETGTVRDDTVSGNGDPYPIFNTVLNTIPAFFVHYPDAMMIVRESDSKSEFIDDCRTNCQRRCHDGECKKAHRRINIYRRFVNMNYLTLKENYVFWGGVKDSNNQTIIKKCQVGVKYVAVVLMKKIVYLGYGNKEK